MNLDTAMNELDKTNGEFNTLMVKREKLKSLILELQDDVRNDVGTNVYRMDAEKDSKIKVSNVSNDMDLESARLMLGSISDSITRSKKHQLRLATSIKVLEKRHSETLALIESLKHKNIMIHHDGENLSPREKLREDTKDMWKKDYATDELEDMSKMSPREQLNSQLIEMWK